MTDKGVTGQYMSSTCFQYVSYMSILCIKKGLLRQKKKKEGCMLIVIHCLVAYKYSSISPSGFGEYIFFRSDNCILTCVIKIICRVVKCAGPRGHILNLGHGVLVGTPEEAVAHFFDVARSLKFDTPAENTVKEEPELVV